jgi:membrane protein implicated in regulation of membrane protease activity
MGESGMTESVLMWICLAVFALFLEILTKTFNMLALAIGFGVAALLAWMGFGVVLELVLGMGVTVGCLMWLRRSAMGHDLQEAEESRYSVMSDDGDEVYISQWDDSSQTEVIFKGRTWQAQLAKDSKATKGRFKVREVREGLLILESDTQPLREPSVLSAPNTVSARTPRSIR